MKKSRRRYLLFKLHRDDISIEGKELSIAIWKSLLSLYGEVQAADSKLYLTDFDEQTGIGILQCNAETLSKVITSAVMIGSIDNTNISFEPIKTSGTIKGLKRQIR